MGTHPSHTTTIRERCRRRTITSVVLLFLCLLHQIKASSTSELPPIPESAANATTLHVNETVPLQQQEGKKEEDHDVRLEPVVVQEIVIPQIVQQEPLQELEEEQPLEQEAQEPSQEQQPPLTEQEAQELQEPEEDQQQPKVLAEEKEGSGSVEIHVPEQINGEAVKEEGVVEEQDLDKVGGKDMEKVEEEEEEEEEDDDEHEAAERDSLEEIKLVIEAQAEEERRLAEDAALDEARAHAAEREAARQEAEEKRQTRRKAGDAHAGATSWGHAAGQGGSSGSSSGSSSSSGTGAGSANASGSGNRGGAFASLSGGSGGAFSRMGGLGQASQVGSSASSFSSSRRGRVPPTDEQAQAEMMSAAFGGGAGGAGTASFEDMMTQQERSMHGGSGEESATVRARLAAKLVLETDALLYGGQGGPGGVGMLGLEMGDEDLEEEEGGVGEGRKAALVADRTGKEIARILREGDKDEPNWYAVLGISRRASAQSVKDNFRHLVLLIHPDKTASRGAQEAFQLVQEAYESLSSPSERRAYDQYLVKLRAKRWKQRIRPIKDKLDELSDYYEPVLERKGKIALGAFLLWALVL